MHITIIGTGYVGLTYGACLAEVGHEVVCIDNDGGKISRLKKGEISIYEPGLEDLVGRNVKARRLSFSRDIKRAVEFAQVVFSAVGTPPGEDYHADLSAVKAVAKSFGEYANEYKLFVNKSTVPVGSGELCRSIIQAEFRVRGVTFGCDQVANPEFLREGAAVADCLKPDRIIVGAETERAVEIMRELNKPIIEKGAAFFATDIRSAEIIKYASNAMLATKISFMNEIARLCELAGADITAVERGVGLDSRIGRRFLHAGIGYGGSCFPKDIAALLAIGRDHGCDFKIISAAQKVNREQRELLFAKLVCAMPELTGKRIALWGLSFKPKTDDMREAPSLVLIEKLLERRARISAFDPAAMHNCKKLFPRIHYAKTALDAVKGACALMLVTEWDEFRSVNFAHVKELMSGNLILDGRNIWTPAEVRACGFEYYSVGR